MERQPEPELMDEDQQARAYALADFEQPHENFVALFRQTFYSEPSATESLQGPVLDLGCGPADVIIRFARQFPDCRILGVDGSDAMLNYGRHAIVKAGMDDRITLQKVYLPDDAIPEQFYSAIISNSLLHHLADPMVLWQTINRYAQAGSQVFIMDLMRPRSPDAATELVEEYAAQEPEILKHDFYNSLLAAYTVGEVEEQLERQGMINLNVKPVSDRHFIVTGIM